MVHRRFGAKFYFSNKSLRILGNAHRLNNDKAVLFD
jgi:hypothetical protein